MKLECSLNSLEYPFNSFDEVDEEDSLRFSDWDDHSSLMDGYRFTKGCFWAFVLSVPLWGVIALFAFKWLGS